MSRLIRKSHNASILLYHVVCVAKYRRVVFDDKVEEALRAVCLEIALRFEMEFIEIGTDRDHVHFLIQSVPTYSPTKLVRILKSVSAREVFSRCPHVKKKLWGGQFWSDGYFVATVGANQSEDAVRTYVQEQGQQHQYQQWHLQPLSLDFS